MTMLEISFNDSDSALQGRQVLESNGFECREGSNYRNIRIDADDAKGIAKMLKKEKIRCGVARIKS